MMRGWLWATLWLSAGCGAAHAVEVLQRTELSGTDLQSHALPSPGAKLTVIVFFSAHCDCQSAHDLRLQELERRFAERGVAFFAIDSEQGASLQRDAELARSRGYAYPILLDPGARLARIVDAQYATYAIVLDPQGRVRYSGGIDSDLVHLRSDATFYLRDALDALLRGRRPKREHGEALGCALQIE